MTYRRADARGASCGMHLTVIAQPARAVLLGVAFLLAAPLDAQRPQPVAPRARIGASAPSGVRAWPATPSAPSAPSRRPSARRHVMRGALLGAGVGLLAGGAFGYWSCATSDDCMAPTIDVGLGAAAGALAGGTVGALLGSVVYWGRR